VASEIKGRVVSGSGAASFVIGVEALDEDLIDGHGVLDDASAEQHLEVVLDIVKL
jgi:hypothetical protein